MIKIRHVISLFAILLWALLASPPPAHAAGHQEICTGAKLQQGQCRAYAGANFTIDFSDLRLDPGQYFLTYRGQPTGAFFSRCINVGNDRWFKVENFPGAGIGKAAFELWKARSGGNVCTAGKLGADIFAGRYSIQFDSPVWKATVLNAANRTLNDAVRIKVEDLPADGDYIYKLKSVSPDSGTTKSVRNEKWLEFEDTKHYYRPNTKLQLWRYSGAPLESNPFRDSGKHVAFLGEAVIEDFNPCAPTIQDPSQCVDESGNRRIVKATSPSVGERPPYNDYSVIEFCDDYRQQIRTALGCVPTDASELVAWILRLSLGVGGGLALLLMSFAGIEIMTSQGDPEKLNEGKERFTSAIIGLVFVVLSVFLLRIIGVDILGTPPLQ